MKVDGIDIPAVAQVGKVSPEQKNGLSDREKFAARKAAKEFESLFVGMMLKSMRQTIGKDMLAGKGQNEDIYRSLLDQEYARAVTEQGGYGLAKTIEKQLLEQSQFKKTADPNVGGEDVGKLK
jgi:flagellar protein FlgJ